MVHLMSPNPRSPFWLHPASSGSAARHVSPPNLYHHPTNLDGLQNQTYNSRRLSVWKSCHESVVSRLLDRFLQDWQIKGTLKDGSDVGNALGCKLGHFMGARLCHCCSPLLCSAAHTSPSNQGHRSGSKRILGTLNGQNFTHQENNNNKKKNTNKMFLVIIPYPPTTIKVQGTFLKPPSPWSPQRVLRVHTSTSFLFYYYWGVVGLQKAAHLMYTSWWVWREVYIHETIAINNAINWTIITSTSFLPLCLLWY